MAPSSSDERWEPDPLVRHLTRAATVVVATAVLVLLVMLIPALRDFADLGWRPALLTWGLASLFVLAVELAKWHAGRPTRVRR